MLKVEKLSYSYPGKDLYNKISFTLEKDQHCAFIGTSGTGKSTLINIIMDPESYLYDGKLQLAEHCRIGYVSQFSELDEASDITVFDYVAQDFKKAQARIDAICEEMGTSSDLEALMEQYQEALDAFDAMGGDTYESNITKKLKLANLGKHEHLPVSKLSGGEFKLVQVIKEMLTSPELIIMDEPDVFLDFAHLNALKDLINSHKGTMLVITHNRYLLNHCFNKILHLENAEIQEYDGRYIDYNFSLLQGKIDLQELAAADLDEIARHQKVVDKLRAAATYYTDATRGRALNARVSMLKRLEARKTPGPFVELKQPSITLSTDRVTEECTAVSVKGYSVSFADTLLSDAEFEIKSNEKVALIGANGTGKTTLLREIYKNSNEAITIHEDMEVAFLSQLQGEMLCESSTVMEEFLNAGFETYDAVASHLALFGFEKELLNQKIGELSGGEKNLIQIAKIAAGNANLLLLDEPTSHLDTYSQIALEQAIANYNGAVLMVSHDFYTIANCADYVLLLEGQSIRKVSMRKFRKMIYANHFNKDYLELEQKKKEVELRIATALKANDYTSAKAISEELEAIIKQM